MGRDSWEFRHTFVLTDLSTIADPGDRITVDGKTEIVREDTWWFQRNQQPIGQVFPLTFCSGEGEYIPALKKGNHIDVVVYTVRNLPVDCVSVASKPLGIIYR